MRPECDLAYLAHVARTIADVRAEIEAMERCGATGEVLDEARRHAEELQEVLSEGQREAP